MSETRETPSAAEALIEKASWVKAAASYLRQMAEVEYALANADSETILATLNRSVGMPDPDATLECVDRLLDVAADYVNAAAELVEQAEMPA